MRGLSRPAVRAPRRGRPSGRWHEGGLGGCLAGVHRDAGELGADGAYGAGGHRQRRDPHPDERAREHRVGRGLATDPDRLAGLLARLGGDRDQLQHGRLPRVGEVREVGGHPVGGHRVLRQVVGADGEEVDDLEHPVREQRRARDLHHHAGLEPARAHLLGELGRLGDGGDHRRHHPRLGAAPLARRQLDAVELAVHQAGVAEGQPQTTHAQRGVLLAGHRGEGDRLVRPGVERADDDVLPLAEGAEHLAVDLALLLGRRFLGGVEEAQLGAEEADALHRLLTGLYGAGPVGHVGEQLDRGAVGGLGRSGPGGQRGARLPAGGDPRRGLVGVAADLDRPGLAVDHQERAGLDVHHAGDAHHARDAELAGDDRGVAGRAAALGDQGDDHAPGPGPRCRSARGPRRRGSTARSAWARPAPARRRGGRSRVARCPRGR